MLTWVLVAIAAYLFGALMVVLWSLATDQNPKPAGRVVGALLAGLLWPLLLLPKQDDD